MAHFIARAIFHLDPANRRMRLIWSLPEDMNGFTVKNVKQTLLRIIFLIASGTVILGAYLYINQLGGISHTPVSMPAWVPFLPSLVWIYLGALVVPWFSLLAIDDPVRFRHCAVVHALAFVMLVTVWLLFPTKMLRPEVPQGWWNELYRYLVLIDKPVNIMPCGHILSPVIVTWFLAEQNRRWLLWLLPLVAISAVSIVTTWQHRPVDILLGAVVAFIAISIVKVTAKKQKNV
jgi:hypothetical protein